MKVQKALAPEEATILQNIASLVDQLLAGGGGGEEVEMAEDMPEDEEVMKESNGPTANPNDKAEDRVELPTDITEGNLSEVGKSLNKLVGLLERREIKKSAPVRRVQKNDAVMETLAGISEVLKSLSTQQQQNNMAISNIIDGLGVAESMVQPEVQKSRPVANLDSTAVLNELVQVLKSQNQDKSKDVRKSSREELRDALPAILG